MKNGIENVIDSFIQVIEQDKHYDEKMDMQPTDKEKLDYMKLGEIDVGKLHNILENSEFGSSILSAFIVFLKKLKSSKMIQK